MTTKTLVYKVARFNQEQGGKNLQQLLEDALKKRKTAFSRRQQTNSDNQFSLINYNGPNKGLRVGEFFDYTLGQKQPLANMDASAETLQISALAPPDKQSEFLHSILYFSVWKNSVILSQSMTLRAPQFENYLNWLLEETKVIKSGDFVSLSDHPPLHLNKKIKNSKAIEFHAPVVLTPTQSEEQVAKSKTVSFKPEGLGWDILKNALPPELKFPNKLRMSEIVMDGSLEVTLKFSWSQLKKNDPTELMDQISNQLRHVDTELDYTIHTRSGKITRDEFKLKKPVSISTNTEGMVNKSDMWDKMHEWLEELIKHEKVATDA